LAQRHGSPDPIDELNTRMDRFAGWVAAHRAQAAGLAGLVLMAAAGYGAYQAITSRAELAAAEELSRIDIEFRQAMGSDVSSSEVVEPANPELGRRAREAAAESLQSVAEEHSGTVAAVLAHLKAGNRLDELGEPEQALEEWRAARSAAPSGTALRGLVLVRVARAHEQAERFQEAAVVYEEASSIEDYPLRYFAMADAARSFASAGQLDRAIELAARVDDEAPDVRLPDHVRSRLRELQPPPAQPPASPATTP